MQALGDFLNAQISEVEEQKTFAIRSRQTLQGSEDVQARIDVGVIVPTHVLLHGVRARRPSGLPCHIPI